MPLHVFSKILIHTLESLPLMDGRFSNLRCVNVRPEDEEKRGVFSLVFSALDQVTNKKVALKFLDPDPRISGNLYRATAFERESTILRYLIDSKRCLQLVQQLKDFELDVVLEDGSKATLLCKYFTVEWLDLEIDHFFFDGTSSSLDKLVLFRNMILAVEALHSREVFHRDLKADNMRMSDDLRRFVIAIDLGTAARFESGFIASSYEHPVGALIYAAPEAACGLAGNRQLAHCSDIYALGCLLFELFNRDFYYEAIRRTNADYDVRLFAMGSFINKKSSESAQVEQWNAALAKHQHGVVPVDIGGPGTTLELAIVPMLNEILHVLTHVSYRNREGSLPYVRRKVESLIKLLTHEEEYQRRLERQKALRKRKAARASEKDSHLKRHSAGDQENANS